MATPPPGEPHGTAWTRMQGGMNPKRSGTRHTLTYIMYRYFYIYHLEGHAEKTRDRSGIYSKKELRSFQSHTEKEAHSRTKWGTNGDTGVSGLPFNMGGAGHGSQGQKPSYTRWEPQDPCAPRWGAGTRSGGRVLLRAWVGPAPSGLVLLTQMVAPSGSLTGPCSGPPRTTRKDLSTHRQSWGLPYPGCRRSWALLPVGWARDGSRGWVANSGVTR